MTTTMFFLSSCANSYIGNHTTYFWRHKKNYADNIKRLSHCRQVWTYPDGVFTLTITETDTNTETETDKMGSLPNDIGGGIILFLGLGAV